jgi:glyoxylase-like metal-dependent hydrolase (beta-lactamase superfamily II)
MISPVVTPFFHAPTGSWSYVVADDAAGVAVIIDPVLDFELRSGRTGTHSAQRIVEHCRSHALHVDWILETHAHADHLSAAAWLQSELGGRIGIGEGIRSVQATFARVYGLGADFATDGSQFDHLFRDGESFGIGGLEGRVLGTPGHTSDSVSYLVGDAVFIGDTLFMPDVGSARCDFPGGDAALLFRSVQRLYALPAQTRVFVCHDYPPDGRDSRAETTIAEQRTANLHLRDGVTEGEYVARRTARDATLDLPQLLIPAVQVNIRGGRLPAPDSNGTRYLRLPLDLLGRALT